MRRESIRNFSIVAHIDHGKSTLADRVLEITGTVEPSRMVEQVLDDMELERERGITIKSHAVKLTPYRGYELNLIDTPGHVDFTYEVSRALAACEGVVLLVDATQGIEAQTLSNLYLALENDLVIIPVINKIDLRSARIDETRDSLAELLGISPDEVLLVSAKTGEGVERLLERIIEVVPPPEGNPDSCLKALIFDSIYNPYRGVIPYIRVFDGTIKRGDKILMFSSGLAFEVDEVGYLGMKYEPTDALEAGEVGYLMANIKDIAHTRIGDTITDAEEPVESPLPGYREAKPMVFSGIYPANNEEFESLREALSKLKLNDASLIFEPETSTALGFGFRCGFLGLLHLEVTQERLEREYGLDLVATAPNVKYRVNLKTGETIFIESPTELPALHLIESIEEPIVRGEIITPNEFIGAIMQLLRNRRGEILTTETLDATRVIIRFEMPLSEIIFDFFDKLKSVTRGYGSLDYELIGFRKAELVKLDICINGEIVDALSTIIHEKKSYIWGQRLASKLKQLIPRQLFEVVIQATIGSRVISRAVVKPLRKNVTAKCYGGDVTRKRKLLERQKAGKKRMKMIGKAQIPQEAFFALLKIER